MKVLIVSENEKTISCLKTFFKAQDGYEVITYRIPLKALDNFGEIAPNLVIYNAVDFPRHWKIFLQYVKSMHDMAIYDSVLIVDKKFDASEKEKSQALGVWKLLSESKLYKYADSAAAETANFTDIITNIAADETEYDVTPELEEKFEVIFDEPLPEIEDVIFDEPMPAVDESTEAVVDEPPLATEENDEAIFNQPISELEESADAIFDEPMPELEESAEVIVDDLVPEIAENDEEIIYEPLPEIENQTEDIIKEPLPEIDDAIFYEPLAAVANEPAPEIKKQTKKIIDQPPAKAEPSATVIFNPVDGENTLEQALREQDILMMSIQMDKPQPPSPTVVKSKEYSARESSSDAALDKAKAPQITAGTQPPAPAVDKQENGCGFVLSEEDIALLKSLEPEKANPREVQFLFRHPQTGALVTGIVETVTGNMVVFKPDDPLVSTTFSMGQYIDSASYKNGDSVSLVGAYAVPYDDTIHLTLEGSAPV